MNTFQLKLEELKKTYNGKHETGAVQAILPFTTHSLKDLKNMFYDFLGDYVRVICNANIDKKLIENDSLEGSQLVKLIKNEIKFNDSDEAYLDQFLNDYLYGQKGQVKVTHPYLYNFLGSSDSLKKLARFAADVLVAGDSAVHDIFSDKRADNLLDELILSKLSIEQTNKVHTAYVNKLPFLQQLYIEDLVFLSKHKEYFLTSFPLLTRFYTFTYVCQLLLKLDDFENANMSNALPLYYALEWEGNISKRRDPAGEIQGYRRIRERSKYLFVHMHTLAQLSHFFANEYEGEQLKFLTYVELMNVLDTDEKCNAYLKSLNEWIVEYRGLFNRVTDKMPSLTLYEGFRTLFKSISEGVADKPAKDFGSYIDGLGGPEFLKVRGSTGTVLNLSHEMLLLLAAVCVKRERIPLNQLFVEFERRGVKLDRISKGLVIEILTNLNFIDKKSDSGDAQYVKPIL